MICSEKFLGLIALAELVGVVEMLSTNVPLRWVGEYFAAVPTDIGTRIGRRGVECSLDASQRSTGPRMTAEMQGVLVTFRFVLVFEPVWTVCTSVLLF